MNNKILNLLGFAAKSGKLSFGFDMSVEAMKKDTSKLVVVAEDISDKTKKEINFFSQKTNTNHILPAGIKSVDIEKAVGKKCGIVSVNDLGFANAIEKAHLEGGETNDK